MHGSCLLWELVFEGSNMVLLIFCSALQPLNNTQYSALPRFQVPAEPHNLPPSDCTTKVLRRGSCPAYLGISPVALAELRASGSSSAY